MNVLFICGGNTCRSPMAKVILEKMIEGEGLGADVTVDSAAYNAPTLPTASDDARKAVEQLFGADLLASHDAKKLDDTLIDWAHLILVMNARMKTGLPANKTWTIKEYAGSTGDVPDPWRQGVEAYVKCAQEVQECLERAWPKLVAELDL